MTQENPLTLSSRTLPLALAGLALTFAGGCELLAALASQEFQVPVDLETPPTELNATEQVDNVESGLCEDPDGYNCTVVKALDFSDDEQVSDPPAIPPEFPVAIDVTNPDTGETETVDVEEWAAEVGLGQDLDLKQVIPMDLSAIVGVDDPSAIEEVTVADVALGWLENSFTFDTVPMDLYIGTELVDDPTADPQALIDAGTVEKVGTIPAQEAGVTGDAPISFVEGGNAKFNTALKGLKFTAVVALPSDQQIELKEGSDVNKRLKPTGEASVSLKATLMYTISGDQLREQADEVSE